MGKGLVSGLSFELRSDLYSYLNCAKYDWRKCSSYHQILSFFPLEISEEIINQIKK